MAPLQADEQAEQGATPEQVTISWVGGQLAVDAGQGPEPVEDIGAALQIALDAYKQASEGMTGESGYQAAFAADRQPQMREPTVADRAGARRY